VREEAIVHFLHDFVQITYERADEASKECKKLKEEGAPNHHFACGRALAYYEVLAHLANQAKAFGIPQNLVGLEQIDLDRLLVG
jgi:hypothetical protein